MFILAPVSAAVPAVSRQLEGCCLADAAHHCSLSVALLGAHLAVMCLRMSPRDSQWHAWWLSHVVSSDLNCGHGGRFG
jgi:hypothetical protein